MKKTIVSFLKLTVLSGLVACNGTSANVHTHTLGSDTLFITGQTSAGAYKDSLDSQEARTTEKSKKVPTEYLRAGIVNYAATLEGTPYKEMGKDEAGFDCSGFVSYVFREFAIEIPSASKEMIAYGEEVDLEQSLPGDIIFFTGSDSSRREPGHVGIIVSKPGEPLTFIHTSSSKKNGCVKYSQFIPYFQHRYLGTRRILE